MVASKQKTGERKMATKINTTERAKEILDACVRYGWKPEVRNDILTIHKVFTPNDMDAFTKADGEYYCILSLLPQSRAGSIWGTDGGGIGAFHAIKYGVFTMNKSGGNKLVLRKLEKLI